MPGAHEGGCYGLAFSRTGGLLASGGADKCVRLWEPSTATPTATLHVRRTLECWLACMHACRQAGRQAVKAGRREALARFAFQQGSAARTVPAALGFQRTPSPPHRLERPPKPAPLLVTVRASVLQGAFEGINAVAFTSDGRLVLGAENKQVGAPGLVLGLGACWPRLEGSSLLTMCTAAPRKHRCSSVCLYRASKPGSPLRAAVPLLLRPAQSSLQSSPPLLPVVHAHIWPPLPRAGCAGVGREQRAPAPVAHRAQRQGDGRGVQPGRPQCCGHLRG